MENRKKPLSKLGHLLLLSAAGVIILIAILLKSADEKTKQSSPIDNFTAEIKESCSGGCQEHMTVRIANDKSEPKEKRTRMELCKGNKYFYKIVIHHPKGNLLGEGNLPWWPKYEELYARKKQNQQQSPNERKTKQ